jgi:hypothetical protein
MYKDRLVYAADWAHYGLTKPQFDRIVIDSIFPPEVEIKIQALGSKWFTTNNMISVAVHNGVTVDTYNVEGNLGGREALVSPHWNSYSTATMPKCLDPRITQIAADRRAAQAKIITEREEFTNKVKKMWDDAPSVNALVKIWPPILDLLPSHAAQAVQQKTTRRTAKQMSQNIDTAALSVHILKAKVGQ